MYPWTVRAYNRLMWGDGERVRALLSCWSFFMKSGIWGDGERRAGVRGCGQHSGPRISFALTEKNSLSER